MTDHNSPLSLSDLWYIDMSVNNEVQKEKVPGKGIG